MRKSIASHKGKRIPIRQRDPHASRHHRHVVIGQRVRANRNLPVGHGEPDVATIRCDDVVGRADAAGVVNLAGLGSERELQSAQSATAHTIKRPAHHLVVEAELHPPPARNPRVLEHQRQARVHAHAARNPERELHLLPRGHARLLVGGGAPERAGDLAVVAPRPRRPALDDRPEGGDAASAQQHRARDGGDAVKEHIPAHRGQSVQRLLSLLLDARHLERGDESARQWERSKTAHTTLS